MNTTQTLHFNSSNQASEQAFLHRPEKEAWGKEIAHFMTIGRDPSCQYSLSDPSVSTRHARIEKKEGYYLLRDLRSRNGTFLNGALILEARLKEGDRIQLGNTHFYFSFKRNIFDQGPQILSRNKKWSKVVAQLPNLAQSDLPVLILGPSGSGKELLCQFLHNNSPRKCGSFVSVNCSALGESLIESELFGHTKGSFTGATENRKGAFESARGGTLFLDEVGDLPLALQPKLLRALENKEVRPVGSDKTIKTDVRIVAATHHDLRQKVIQGDFRLDLYYRLNVLQIKAPSLRERMEDFEPLLTQFCKEHQISIAREVIDQLKRKEWQGNIRELKNFVAKAKALCGSKVSSFDQLASIFEAELIEPSLENQNIISSEGKSKMKSSIIKELEFEIIKKRLIANKGNQRQTAFDLGIPKSTLHDRIKAYGIKIKASK